MHFSKFFVALWLLTSLPIFHSPALVWSQVEPLLDLVEPNDVRVPQMLLPAIHSEEVQKELQLSNEDQAWLEEHFRELDGNWWRSRNLPGLEQRTIVHQVEKSLWEQLSKRFNPSQLSRLQQLVMQAQNSRVLLRSDVARRLMLTDEQQKQLDEIVQASHDLRNKLEEAEAGGNAQEIARQLQARFQTEAVDMLALLTPAQQLKLKEMLGRKLDLSAARRVYPQAPEFAESSQWFGTPPGKMADLRGKVIVIHFYAFQCINCRRNFHHYNQWAKQWEGQDVAVIGIQTPETAAEKQPQRVQKAAEEDGFQFPVLMDSQNENWNAWGNTMWPTVYVIDKKGYIRMWWQGELNWQGATGDRTITEMVDQLLKQ